MTVQVKLLPTKEQIRLLKQRSQEYMKLITILVSEMVKEKKNTKDIKANLPSTVKKSACQLVSRLVPY
ncbi:hypothetical protein BLX06_25750 [Bacillus cereus]|uniref:Transposase n=1 Tax=Bacillus cereus TaxID=1396 RepID=A0A9X6GDR9_BACCE|nr:hypothetical protein BLX06_25750 [Bacillus cereus]